MQLSVYNTNSRKKEEFHPINTPNVGMYVLFHPINTPNVGMYVCGPTVYGDAHLGHARGAITFDIVFRFLTYLGYKVRYVRNITDVGHLENDADEGADKIAKKAILEQLEPMEIAQRYTIGYHRDVALLNCLPPSIEPRATGHIVEQIAQIEQIITNGFAYIANGSVYFDVIKYAETHEYGKLSGRILDDLLSNTRDLDGQSEKRNSADFALWKNASSEHIMKWNSPWGVGFPGWHIECTAMSTKYLGNQFDIHGGGMDLLFPHHESEIAQSHACNHTDPAKYWLHNNMITINGQKMGKSLGNFITLQELFDGSHKLLEQAYSPMTIRFFILQAQYRSTLNFSNEALKAAGKGLKKLMNTILVSKRLGQSLELKDLNESLETEIVNTCNACKDAMCDDFNTAVLISHLYQIGKYINSFDNKQLDIDTISKTTFNLIINTLDINFSDVLGLKIEYPANIILFADDMLKLYLEAKINKQYDKVDQIRLAFKQKGLVIKDNKTSSSWTFEE